MASDTILIGSRLPIGLTIDAVDSNGVTRKATIRGTNSVLPVVAPYVTTPIPRGLAEAWVSENPDFPAIRNGSIFPAESEADALAVSREVGGEKTGFEPVSQTEGGVKPAES